jgi:hypothetical protein
MQQDLLQKYGAYGAVLTCGIRRLKYTEHSVAVGSI